MKIRDSNFNFRLYNTMSLSTKLCSETSIWTFYEVYIILLYFLLYFTCMKFSLLHNGCWRIGGFYSLSRIFSIIKRYIYHYPSFNWIFFIPVNLAKLVKTIHNIYARFEPSPQKKLIFYFFHKLKIQPSCCLFKGSKSLSMACWWGVWNFINYL